MDLIIQKATELGVSRIVPPLGAHRRSTRWGRSRKKTTKVAAGRDRSLPAMRADSIPVVDAPVKVETFVRQAKDALRLIAAISPDASSLKTILTSREGDGIARPDAATLMIGPEGDFTPAEISQALSSGFTSLSLGPIILRSETAAIYALSITIR